MTATANKQYLSISQLGMLGRCGIQYEYRYLRKEVLAPGIAATRGTGVHVAAGANGEQKIHSGTDLPASDLRDIAVASFEAQLHSEKGVWLSPDQSGVGSKTIIGEAIDDTVALTDLYAAEVAPAYQPTMVEQTFKIELPGERDFLGVIDMIDDKRRVVDYKSAAKAKTQAEADTSLQLTAYAAGHEVLTGEEAESVALEVLVASKNPRRQTLVSHRGASDYSALAARVNAANDVLDAGVFLPADPGDWCCSAKWCGYYHKCPFAHGRNR